MPSRFSALAGLLLFALAVPASAQAVPTIEPLRPCYVTAGTAKNPQGEGVQINAQGFSANSKVDLAVNGAPYRRVAPGSRSATAGVLDAAAVPGAVRRERLEGLHRDADGAEQPREHRHGDRAARRGSA